MRFCFQVYVYPKAWNHTSPRVKRPHTALTVLPDQRGAEQEHWGGSPGPDLDQLCGIEDVAYPLWTSVFPS